MNRRPILASAAALAFAFAVPVVSAQTLKGSPALVLADHSVSASKLIGMTVADSMGMPLGTVVDILVRDKAAEPTVILSVGDYVGGGVKLVAVPLSHVQIKDAQPVMSGTTKQMMASMEAFRFDGLNGGGG